MLRRISTKWILTVLAAVILPFLGFAWFVNTQMARRQSDTVNYYLLSTAGEMADRIDNEIRVRHQDIELWISATPLTEWAVGDYDADSSSYFVPMLRRSFDRFIERSRAFDLILAINEHGHLVVANTSDARGNKLPQELQDSLEARDYGGESWFKDAMEGREALVDHHMSNLEPPRVRSSRPHPENYHIGFGVPVRDQLNHEHVIGVVYGLMNWSHIQNQVLRPIRPRAAGVVLPDIYSSCYAWLWMADGDTIIGHPNADLYTKRVSQPPVSLPQLVDAAMKSDWGMYPEYRFRNVDKRAAFKHCAGPEKGGFGWIVGVGVDNENIYATVHELSSVLWQATLLVLGTVVLCTILIARRTTRPILELQQHTLRIAAGDLETHIDVRSKDELGALAQAFNRMTRELRDSRAKLIKAEKDAAWREMARQVAHEIKNPLTPISLSATLLKRARDEHSPEFDKIFERTIDLVQRQVENMRAIAADFSAFAGARTSRPEVVDVSGLLDEVLTLNAAWAAELGIQVERSGSDGMLFADRGELRRLMINLVSNAFEAMPKGGTLRVEVQRLPEFAPPMVEITIRDTGEGLSDEVRARLFEPYFTTRTHGTGLGLAIAARLVDEMNGSIELLPVPASEGHGTIARVRLPEHRA